MYGDKSTFLKDYYQYADCGWEIKFRHIKRERRRKFRHVSKKAIRLDYNGSEAPGN